MQHAILNYLPVNIKNIIKKLDYSSDQLLEIRLRVNKPLEVNTFQDSIFLSYQVKHEDIEEAMIILTDNSLYALERQLREGFITIKGGHRIGFSGQVIVKDGNIKTIKNINSINYRLTRELPGTADRVINYIYNYRYHNIYNTLIISPPICGKTTLLRDIIRQISNGQTNNGIESKKVGVVDERSEIAGAYNGIAQNKIGKRTDLLDNCPKAKGMLLLIRSMSPEVIAVDEIGSKEDVRAIEEAVNTGVKLIATIHGNDLKTIKNRPAINRLIDKKFFSRFIILSRRDGIGTVEAILNQQGERIN